MKKKMWMISLLTAVVILFVTSCGQTTQRNLGKPTIKIGYLPITHAGPLYLDAHVHGGQFEDYNIEMVKFNSWPDLMDALNTGRVDGASVLIQLAMKAVEKGIDLKAVALGHKDGNVLISSKEIEDASELKGKTFAIPHKYSTHNLLLYETLKKENLTYEDVNVVEMPPAEMPAALAGGRISGFVVAEPFGALAVNLDKGHVLYHSDDIWPNSYCCVLVLRNDFIQDNQTAAQSMVTQYVKSGEQANQKDEDLYQSFEQFMKVDREVLNLSLEWISFDGLRIEKMEYEKLRNLLLEMELMEKPPLYEEFVDNTFIEKAM
ncbi:NitT/TauT family transport system substrate-binding protein [Neobacillus niacini]|uniref:ABC transporter substrate-binding protein n=1 Tax=Neobacillus niacini TaxID=86668 RepID=UPI0027850019|nr:ABC transporter substrate-binding protein [Neobacillus niacini]MDQ1004385.1 NitT/TauT family transport system substrate-binding protein [Neobacillus niacini]